MIRVGRIAYVNTAPFFYRLAGDVEQVTGVPTEINRLLLEGELDVAAISSIEYARHADQLRLLPRLCIAADGAVGSVQLVSGLPLEEIRSVAATSESATSVALTQILLRGVEVRPLGADADATLLIGDAALRSLLAARAPHYDLGLLWHERTGLPMVFAVCAAREGVSGEVEALEEALLESVRAAGAARERFVSETSGSFGFPAPFLRRYFEQLRYELGNAEQRGLERFFAEAREAGLLPDVPELRFVAEEVAA